MSKRNLASKTAVATPGKLKELEEHAYYRAIVKNSLIPFMQAKKEAGDARRDFLPTIVQQYHIDVFYNSYCLFEAVKRLYEIPFFTFNNPSFKSLTNNGITPEDWFVYHYANFRVVATGIYDTTLIVTNFLFRIDYHSKDCTDKKIRKHPKVIEKQVDIHLTKLRTILEKYREERNFYVHRSERPELKFVDQLKAYRFLKEAKEKRLYKGELPNQTTANALFMEQRNNKCAEMRNEADEICSRILDLCDAWHQVYLEMFETFKDESI